MRRHCGIILRQYMPKKNKIAVIDQKLGRIDGVVHGRELSAGSMIGYEARPMRNLYMFESIKIEDIPLSLARADILFLHHVLELCYLFIPIGSCVKGVFDLLVRLYEPKSNARTNHYKKIFLFKLLTTLGIHASNELVHSSHYTLLLTMSIDTLTDYSLDLASEKALDNWLCRCIVEYAGVDSLKTIHFLTKNRVA